jgi:hypothetical protein
MNNEIIKYKNLIDLTQMYLLAKLPIKIGSLQPKVFRANLNQKKCHHAQKYAENIQDIKLTLLLKKIYIKE